MSQFLNPQFGCEAFYQFFISTILTILAFKIINNYLSFNYQTINNNNSSLLIADCCLIPRKGHLCATSG